MAEGLPAAPAPPLQRHPLRSRPSGERRSLLDSGLNDFRSVVAETDELGEATARSLRSAREGYADAPPFARDLDRGAPGAFDPGDSDEVLQDVPIPEMLEPHLGMDEA